MKKRFSGMSVLVYTVMIACLLTLPSCSSNDNNPVPTSSTLVSNEICSNGCGKPLSECTGACGCTVQ